MISTMINQAAVEALYSASYIEDYLDCVENLPGELQRSISRLREIEMSFDGLLRDVEQQSDMLIMEVDSIIKKKLMSKIEQALINTQELGDEKLQILQHVQDLVENRTRQLDLDYRNLADVGKEPDTVEAPPKEVHPRELNPFPTFTLNNGGSSGERQSKRVRRTRNDILTHTEVTTSLETIPTPEPVVPRQVQQTVQQTSPAHTVSSSTQKKPSGPAIGKKKKRKSRQSGQSTPRDSQSQSQSTSGRDSQRESVRDDSPPRDDEMLIDPDEPTYCLCDQISYGEMIMCDNDLCPFEWFHFSCVSLGVKPKGKWYCPKCRGDRSSIMKPKAQFMKELERFKQERDSKEDKSS